jgi:hypothetical protein
MQAIPEDDTEFDKRITASLADGSPLLVFDNADQPLQSGALSRLVTGATYKGRLLGHSRMAEYPNRATVLITGNNLKLRGDIARRSVWCRLDARVARPWEREGWRHPALLAWVAEHRAELIAAVLTLVRAWIARGCPEGRVRPLGSFEGWTRTLAGILEVAGIGGFLSNLPELYEQADEGGTQWAAFLGALWDAFGEQRFTSAEVVTALEQEGSALRAALPDDLAGALDRPRLQSAIGTAFSRRVETRFDEWRLVRAGTHARAVLWRVSAAAGTAVPDSSDSPASPDSAPTGASGGELVSRSESLSTVSGSDTPACADCGEPTDGPTWTRCRACLARIGAATRISSPVDGKQTSTEDP